MALKLDSLLITLLTLTTLIIHSAQCSDIIPETLTNWWKPIKHLKDPKVAEIGKLFVTTYNAMKNRNLEYESVIQGETQVVVAGVKYRLTTSAKEEGVSRNFVVIYFQHPVTRTGKFTYLRHLPS
ncbi:hypothetical protein POM88_014561 [Heracleum sosnowskyi]|uniref:Cystatin domain-containing protein n=1 Tax=Heracleum sosnowskyi TaxID=360622 RepID=A0AAD8MZ30_9APIA|nr:hypothetical protein POM88_014561 [Heracleum sosnowskyi]